MGRRLGHLKLSLRFDWICHRFPNTAWMVWVSCEGCVLCVCVWWHELFTVQRTNWPLACSVVFINTSRCLMSSSLLCCSRPHCLYNINSTEFNWIVRGLECADWLHSKKHCKFLFQQWKEPCSTLDVIQRRTSLYCLLYWGFVWAVVLCCWRIRE